jgi:hypothetical protein
MLPQIFRTDDVLLEIEGASLEPLLQGLLARQLIREPLAVRYGLDPARQKLLSQSPFRLRLRPQTSGRFQASLELQLLVGRQGRRWQPVLTRLATSLREQGLRQPAAPPDQPANPKPEQEAMWSREDGVVVGGWRWLRAGREEQLLLYLGPTPSLPLPYRPDAANPLTPGGLRLRARPLALQQLGLLPSQMPPLVQRAEQLSMQADPAAGGKGSAGSLSQLWGHLQLGR